MFNRDRVMDDERAPALWRILPLTMAFFLMGLVGAGVLYYFSSKQRDDMDMVVLMFLSGWVAMSSAAIVSYLIVISVVRYRVSGGNAYIRLPSWAGGRVICGRISKINDNAYACGRIPFLVRVGVEPIFDERFINMVSSEARIKYRLNRALAIVLALWFLVGVGAALQQNF